MKQAFLKLAKCLMAPIGALYCLAAPHDIKILMYHRVNDEIHKELSVATADFRWQMEYLKRKGYKVVSLDEAMLLLLCSGWDYRRYVVLTFDDGYEDFYLNAHPVLRDFGYPATMYLVPGYIETRGVFWWDSDIGESRLMNWDEILELQRGGKIQFGSHTVSHADLNTPDADQIRREIGSSKEMLERRLSREIRHFAYPRGLVPKTALDEFRARYRTAVSIFDGDALVCGRRAPDRMKLRRYPVQRSDGRLLFVARLKGWLAPEGWIRKMLGQFA